MIKVQIDKRYDSMANDIYIMSVGDGYRAYLQVNAKKGTFWQLAENQDLAKPVLSLNDDELQQLATALNSLGLKSESQHKLEGTLEATKEHLQDMRTLVFKPTKSKLTGKE